MCRKWRTSLAKLPCQVKHNLFMPKTALEPVQNKEIKGKQWFQFPVSKRRLGSSDCTICPSNTLNGPKKVLKYVPCGRCPFHTTVTPYLRLCGTKHDFEGTRLTSNYPLDVVSTPSKLPERMPRPLNMGPLGYYKRQEDAQRGRCQKWPRRSNGCKKIMQFQKNDA